MPLRRRRRRGLLSAAPAQAPTRVTPCHVRSRRCESGFLGGPTPTMSRGVVLATARRRSGDADSGHSSGRGDAAGGRRPGVGRRLSAVAPGRVSGAQIRPGAACVSTRMAVAAIASTNRRGGRERVRHSTPDPLFFGLRAAGDGPRRRGRPASTGILQRRPGSTRVARPAAAPGSGVRHAAGRPAALALCRPRFSVIETPAGPVSCGASMCRSGRRERWASRAGRAD